jgi:peptidoglycan hydrolase CwlO-like protein
MVTLGSAYEDMDNELESMLDMVSEALNLLEKGKKEDAINLLADLEDAMLDFLDYEEVADEEVVEEEKAKEEAKPAVAKAAAKKPAPKKAAPAKKSKGKK